MPRATAPETGTADAPAAAEPVAASEALTDAQAAQASMVDKMREHLAKQPKREVRVRNDGDVFVQINGYSLLIQPNVKVKVPEQVAEMLEEAGYI